MLKQGQWRRRGWSDIARDAGLKNLHAYEVYRYLCSYAHSGSLSALQLREPKTPADRQRLADGILRVINVAVAFMARAYCSLFPRAKAALQQDAELHEAVMRWVTLAVRGESAH